MEDSPCTVAEGGEVQGGAAEQLRRSAARTGRCRWIADGGMWSLEEKGPKKRELIKRRKNKKNLL